MRPAAVAKHKQDEVRYWSEFGVRIVRITLLFDIIVPRVRRQPVVICDTEHKYTLIKTKLAPCWNDGNFLPSCSHDTKLGQM